MQITLLVVGKKMPEWIQAGYQQYARRMKGDVRLQLREVDQAKGATPAEIKDREGKQLIKSIPKGAHIVALDVLGTQWDTDRVAVELERWQSLGKSICLLIGGPEGLSDECLELSHQRWSLSALTFPHPLVRVLIAEQLYRAHSLLNNHPYHRR